MGNWILPGIRVADPWPGSEDERMEMAKVLKEHCPCANGEKCTIHSLLTDGKEAGHMVYARRMADKLMREEGIEAA